MLNYSISLHMFTDFYFFGCDENIFLYKGKASDVQYKNVCKIAFRAKRISKMGLIKSLYNLADIDNKSVPFCTEQSNGKRFQSFDWAVRIPWNLYFGKIEKNRP